MKEAIYSLDTNNIIINEKVEHFCNKEMHNKKMSSLKPVMEYISDVLADVYILLIPENDDKFITALKAAIYLQDWHKKYTVVDFTNIYLKDILLNSVKPIIIVKVKKEAEPHTIFDRKVDGFFDMSICDYNRIQQIIHTISNFLSHILS